jgi:hypothetical protein
MSAKKKKPTYRLTPEYQGRFVFSAKDLVDLFLNETAHWYRTKDNGLYGKRSQVRRVLTKYLETGEDIADKKEMIYALNKFQREWLEDKPMFAKVT